MDSPNINISSLLAYDNVQQSVSHLRKKLEDFCQEKLETMSCRGKVLDDIFILRNRSICQYKADFFIIIYLFI